MARPLKRKNPFDDEIPRQLKIHVGPKELADKDEMDRIYALTKALLFKGANPDVSSQRLQAVGGMNGFVNGAHKLVLKSPLKGGTSPRQYCSHCDVTGQGTSRVRCTDCDCWVCIFCHRSCIVCRQNYCQFCSVLNYEESDVRSFCLNCLSATR